MSSYYSMFYIANAVLIKKGYKTGDKIAHKVTADALITIIRSKLKLSQWHGISQILFRSFTIYH